jgi:hypothetical protein
LFFFNTIIPRAAAFLGKIHFSQKTQKKIKKRVDEKAGFWYYTQAPHETGMQKDLEN